MLCFYIQHKKKQSFYGHNILTEGVFATQMCVNAEIQFERIVWVKIFFFPNSFIVQRLFTLVQKQGFQNCSLNQFG